MTDDYSSMTEEFRRRLETARQLVANAREGGDKLALANALKRLGDIERRPPFLRETTNETFAEAADLYRELELPLEEAWVLRHIGINHEYAERLAEAEKHYDASLNLFRQHATANSPNYANAVRYPAVIKNRVGKRDESIRLWEEAAQRYDEAGISAGVAEAAAWLTIFALDNADLPMAHRWFGKAEAAALLAKDTDTDTFIAEVKEKLTRAGSETEP